MCFLHFGKSNRIISITLIFIEVDICMSIVRDMNSGRDYTEGPISIPRRRQMASDFHRLFSIKAGMRIVSCESALELQTIVSFEGMPSCMRLTEQPLRINRAFGKKPWYTFDLETELADGTRTLWEIKPVHSLVPAADGLMKPPHWDEIEAWCGNHGRDCNFITNDDLQKQQRLIANWRRILPFARQAYENPDAALQSELLHRARRDAGFSLESIWSAEPRRDRQIVTAQVALLLHRGDLRANFGGKPWSISTVYRVAQNEIA